MYDIDAGRSHALRLDGPCRQDLYSERADVRRKMEALSLRFCDLTMQIDAMERQARPIPVNEPTLSASTDFWDHQHRVMAGTTAKVARTSGHIDLMTAAAAGEIEDPAVVLRAAQTYAAYRPGDEGFVRVTGVRRLGEGE